MESDNQIKAQKLAMKYLLQGSSKVLFFSIPVIEITFISPELQNILYLLKINKTTEAKDAIKKLKCEVPYMKALIMLSKLFSTMAEEDPKDLHGTSQALADMYMQDNYRELMSDVTLIVTHDLFKKFLDLAEKVDNLPGAAYETILILFNFFKAIGKAEPFTIRKMREDLEYTFLIQQYINGSKEIPDKNPEPFNYGLLSEFLHKDDLNVLKSLESYIMQKSLTAAGSAAQSIEKEDLEPGVKKIKKDVVRIEELE